MGVLSTVSSTTTGSGRITLGVRIVTCNMKSIHFTNSFQVLLFFKQWTSYQANILLRIPSLWHTVVDFKEDLEGGVIWPDLILLLSSVMWYDEAVGVGTAQAECVPCSQSSMSSIGSESCFMCDKPHIWDLGLIVIYVHGLQQKNKAGSTQVKDEWNRGEFSFRV